MEIDHEIISTVILLPSAESFMKGCCQLQAKVCTRLLVNCLFKLAQEKSVVRLTDRPAMTIAVYMGRKATKQTNKQTPAASQDVILSKKRITKMLIRMCGCAGWSAPLLFANHQRQFFSRHGPFYISVCVTDERAKDGVDLIGLVKSTNFSDSEVQSLTDILLSKQGSTAFTSDWNKVSWHWRR